MKKFIVKLTAITFAIALIGWLIFSLFLPEYYLPIFPLLLAFFFIVTVGIHAWQFKMEKKDIGKFARSSMIVTFLKLMIYSILAVVYIALDRQNAVQFVIVLMSLYIIFSFFEVKELTRINRTKRN